MKPYQQETNLYFFQERKTWQLRTLWECINSWSFYAV